MAVFVKRPYTEMTIDDLIRVFHLANEVYEYGLSRERIQQVEGYLRSHFRQFRQGKTILCPISDRIRLWIQPFDRQGDDNKVYLSPEGESTVPEKRHQRFREGLQAIFGEESLMDG